MVASLINLPKPTQAAQFLFNSTVSKFNSHKDRWDRLMRDLEAGKIKRLGQGKR
jgi:hypothetical protein